MKTFSWKNQYIDLCLAIPEMIIPARNSCLLAGQREVIQAKIAKFERSYLEIGSGSGGHLIERAANDPDALYIGIELRFKRTYRTAQKAEERKIKNLLVIRSDAKIIEEMLNPTSLDGVYVNFPDPWAKKTKWKKHRILNEDFVTKLVQFLKPNGFISYKTDHAEYFATTLKMLEKMSNYQLTKVTKNLHSSEFAEESVPTEFEMLFKSQGLPIFFLEASKSSNFSQSVV